MIKSSVRSLGDELDRRHDQLRRSTRVSRWIASLVIAVATAGFLGPDQAAPTIEHVDARWLAMLLVVLTTADVAGFAAGVVTTIVGAVSIDLWIAAHGNAGLIPEAQDAVAVALFVVAAVTGCALIARPRPAVAATSDPIAPQRQAGAEPLTERELGVLGLLNMGLSNDDIARHLVVSPNTVKSHLEHLYGKLGVSSRGRAVAEGHRRGLIGPVERG